MDHKQLYRKIYIDETTGCLNRNAFADCEPHKAIAIVDMDSLKWINDNRGHLEGDKELSNLGKRLRMYFDHSNVYRLSGDEFVVVGKTCAELLYGLNMIRQTFSFGVSTTLDKADANLIENKIVREATGLRAPRGEKPVWYK
jgi:diguanylate cyclase (GGDEF)-like protein